MYGGIFIFHNYILMFFSGDCQQLFERAAKLLNWCRVLQYIKRTEEGAALQV